ncbi:MAG: hypothetical protein J7L88_04230, partial [Thermoplasmata archaeon]|nr:hypothetical protein [Thermoplasmata archaeon]
MVSLKKVAVAVTLLLMVVPLNVPSANSTHSHFKPHALSPPSWPMIGRDAHHSGQGLSSSEGIYRPYLRWNTTFSQTSFGAVFGNFTDNVHFNSTTPSPLRALALISGGTLYLLNGEDGEVVWRANFDSLDGVTGDDIGWAAPLLLDSDSDGRAEILIAFPNSTEESRVILYEPAVERSSSGWSQLPAEKCEVWNTTIEGEARYSSPISGDLNGDGYTEIV